MCARIAVKILAIVAFIAESTPAADSEPHVSLMTLERDPNTTWSQLRKPPQCSVPLSDADDVLCLANESVDSSEAMINPDVLGSDELQLGNWVATAEEVALLGAPVAVVPLVRQRVPSRSTGKFTVLKSVYHGRIKVGGKVFSTVFDSGSGHLILPGVKCQDKACLKHRQYDTATSSTGTDIDYDGTPVKPGGERDQLTVNFGTGEVTGVFVNEHVCLPADPRTAGFAEAMDELRNESSNPEEAEDMNATACVGSHMIVATAMSDNPFNDFSFDGVFGLALPGLSQTEHFNMATQITKGLTSGRQAFSFYFSEDPLGSKIYVGGLLRSNLESPLAWVPVKDPEDGYWKVELSSVHISGTPLAMCENGCHGVADTGTSVLAAPTVVVKQLRESFKKIELRDGKCQVPVDNPNGTGTFSVTMKGGLKLELEPNEFAQPRLPLHSSGFNASDVNASLGCELMLMRLDVPPPLGPLVILGEPFLTKYTTLFDVENRRLGFARSRHMRAPVDPSQLAAVI